MYLESWEDQEEWFLQIKMWETNRNEFSCIISYSFSIMAWIYVI